MEIYLQSYPSLSEKSSSWSLGVAKIAKTLRSLQHVIYCSSSIRCLAGRLQGQGHEKEEQGLGINSRISGNRASVHREEEEEEE